MLLTLTVIHTVFHPYRISPERTIRFGLFHDLTISYEFSRRITREYLRKKKAASDFNFHQLHYFQIHNKRIFRV